VNKIIFLSSRTHTPKDFLKTGIKNYIKNKISVEVWYLQKFLKKKNQNRKKINYKNKNFKIRNIKSLYQIDNLLRRSAVNCIHNIEVPYIFENRKIFQLLSKYKIPFIISPGVYSKSKWIKIKTKDYLKYKIRQLKSGKFPHFKNIIIKKIFSFINPKYWNISFAHYSYIIGKYAYNNRKTHSLIKDETKIIWGHSRTYDEYRISLKKKAKAKKKSILFIDQGIPFHPDTSELGLHSIKAEEYYYSINNFLEKIYKKFGYKAEIAAHPRIDPKKLKKYFPNFKIKFRETINQVKYSSLIITHDSTAMNYAVLYNKPLLFITNNSLNKGIHSYYEVINSKANMLNKKCINIDLYNNINIANYLDIDKKAYNGYLKNFIKFKGSNDFQSNVIIKKLKNDRVWI